MPSALRADESAAPQTAPVKSRTAANPPPVEQVVLNSAMAQGATPDGATKKVDAAAATMAANSAADWIQRLGDERWDVREEASRRLGKMGIEIQPALDAARHDPDPEIRVRVRRIRDSILKVDLKRRVDAFAKDVNDSKHLDLPGWARFKEVVGDGATARRLFVEMQRAEPALFLALQDGPDASSIALQNCIVQNWGQSVQRGRSSGVMVAQGSAAAFMFVGADKRLTIGDDVAVQVVNMVNQGSFCDALSNPSQAKLIKKLFGAWIARNASTTVLSQNLWISTRYEIKEGVDLASTVLRQGNQPIYTRHIALMAIAKMGGKDQLPTVELCMKDTDLVNNSIINNQPSETQIRDVALAVEIHLYGQDLKAYGFKHSDLGDDFPFYNPMVLGFRNDSERDAAVKKWTKWLDENRKKA